MLILSLLFGCNLRSRTVSRGTSADIPVTDSPKILSAYHGLDELPQQARVLCDSSSVGEDGLPVVFSVQLDTNWVKSEHFIVETASGERITPVCATLAPAVEILENRTVLLAGSFGSTTEHPKAVEVVGDLLDPEGNSLKGIRTENITALAEGPSIVLAEYFPPDTAGIEESECPEGTKQVIQLTWEGGVTGSDGAALGDAQRMGVTAELENGDHINPISLGDDDPDNHVLLCLDTEMPALQIKVQEGLFYDPGNDGNPLTSIEVTRY